jgi:hypothetical protein
MMFGVCLSGQMRLGLMMPIDDMEATDKEF